LRWAIDNHLTFYCSSPLNYDPKLHLGCDLAPLDLYVKHTQPLLNPIFRQVFSLLEPTRHDPVLPKFSNAAELYEWRGSSSARVRKAAARKYNFRAVARLSSSMLAMSQW